MTREERMREALCDIYNGVDDPQAVAGRALGIGGYSEPSEPEAAALTELERIEQYQIGADGEVVSDFVDADWPLIRRALRQRVPEAVRRLPDDLRQRAGHCGRAATNPMTTPDEGDAAKYALRAAIYHGVADELESAIAQEESDG